jgi:NADH-quinone oxidoreductase subunit C
VTQTDNHSSGAAHEGAAAAAPLVAPRWAAALSGLAYKHLRTAEGTDTLEVERGELRAVLTALKDGAGFAMCTFVTAVDHYPRTPRFAVSHQLLSLEHNDRLRVRCWLLADDAHLPTCSDLWPGANWSERECFDMFGIVFDGHPDLRRLMMPPGYDHHPLRKEFPHVGIEPDRLYRQWDRKRREGWSETQ